MIPGGRMVKGAILLGGTALTAYGVNKVMSNDEGMGEITGDDGGTTERTSQSFTTRGGPEAEQLKNQMAESRGEETQGFNQGGLVQHYDNATQQASSIIQGFNQGGIVTDPEEKKQQEDYMLHWVNKERTEFLGLPPLDKITYAEGVELTKAMGPEYYGKGIKETEDIDMNFDTMTKTTWKTKSRGAETIFQGSVGRLTEEDKQAYLDSNPNARLAQALQQQIEMDNLGADISASAKMNGGGLVQGFKGGGLVTVPKGTINSYQDLINAGVEVEDVVTGSGRFGSVKWIEKQPKKGLFGREKLQKRSKNWNVSGVGGGADKELAMSTEDYVNMKMGWKVAGSQKTPPKLDRVTGDPGKRTAPKLDRGGNITPRKTATVITPSEKKKVTVAYQEEKQSMENNSNAEKSSQEIPQFDVTLGRSSKKISLLGISV